LTGETGVRLGIDGASKLMSSAAYFFGEFEEQKTAAGKVYNKRNSSKCVEKQSQMPEKHREKRQ
jgi:hypothetical protein